MGAVYLGQIIGLPDWTRGLSPFGHVPALPAGDFELAPVLGLLVVAAGLSWSGLLALRRRDVSAA
ncbi:hypothetical protein RM844_20245 [Streptomyces sp. DSM 44915]|uniref:ABC transporter permease n=1 Tax=Streptomyces chisholmiae TaxID=3075540 RepID=A0ABU2JUG5_9ACTN|nr:hypothetical protein [Streptomyces sp. DSM 44915]MDT0268619.1 hypothetical protein [Streptomyces sp. DSM 44915]